MKWPTSDWRPSHEQLTLALTVVVGILAGLSAVLFSLAIDGAQHVFFSATPSAWRLVAVPVLVSVVAGILLVKVFPGVRGSGIPQTKEAYHLRSGTIPASVPIGKFIMGVLCIGSGHSIGREGPSVQIGAGIASCVGRWLRLPASSVRTLVPVGASAALAAAFNTPVAAVLFALEEIIGDLNAALLGSTVLASVTAVIVARSILGNEPLFHVPDYQLAHPGELLIYAVLGVLGGMASVAFSKTLLRARREFLSLPVSTRIWQPAMGGLAIGGLLLIAPEVAGVGYAYVDQALNGGLILSAMLMLFVLKMVATIVSYASGNAGGIFAPTLYFGAMLGGVVGLVAQGAPFPVAGPGAYALVGMGALFAGIVRAPMTSVFMIFEITQDYQVIVPLMVANMLALAISRHYQHEPLYHALLLQDGVHLPRTQPEVVPSEGWQAADVMSREFSVLAAGQTTEALLAAFPPKVPVALVGQGETVVGLARRDHLEADVAAGRGVLPARVASLQDSPHVHPDHPIDVVLIRLRASGGVLPVLSRLDVRRVEGVITRDSITGILVPAESPRPE